MGSITAPNINGKERERESYSPKEREMGGRSPPPIIQPSIIKMSQLPSTSKCCFAFAYASYS